jgi:hypothetical protein
VEKWLFLQNCVEKWLPELEALFAAKSYCTLAEVL